MSGNISGEVPLWDCCPTLTLDFTLFVSGYYSKANYVIYMYFDRYQIYLEMLLASSGYGGIFLDADVLVIKSFDPLRQYSVTFGRESTFGVCNGIIIAERGAPFLRLLREQYHSCHGGQEIWAQKSVINTDLLVSVYPKLNLIDSYTFHQTLLTQKSIINTDLLARLYPHLVHIEDTTLNRPD